jgi:thiamine-phosphate pyrophosphorylase
LIQRQKLALFQRHNPAATEAWHVKSLFPQVAMTPSCERILRRFECFLATESLTGPGHLVLALLMEESLGSKCLNDLGISIGSIADGCIGEDPARTAMALIETDDVSPEVLAFSTGSKPDGSIQAPQWCNSLLERARAMARRSPGGGELSSELLLQAMVELDGPLKDLLRKPGVTLAAVMAELGPELSVDRTLQVDFELTFDEPTPAPRSTSRDSGESQRVLALIDANLNRAREGLRVLEDFARFVRRDLSATTAIKQLRHDLVSAELAFRSEYPAAFNHRDTTADAGTTVSTVTEMNRDTVDDVVTANARRVQEALRSLEEFGKTVDVHFAGVVKQLRYRSYTAEQLIAQPVIGDAISPVELRTLRLERLQQAQLYLLITESLCLRPWQDVVRAALKGGVDVIQLREKELDDEQLIQRGQWLAEICEQTNTLFILNDRVDLAAAAGAHGVHIGQTDTGPADARAKLLPHQLLGVSTHNAQQIASACQSGADYLGVGPVFQSRTKSFDTFAGLDLITEASSAADRPWFGIGGIDSLNLSMVIDTGAIRVAVCSAVAGQSDPTAAARELKRQLLSVDPEENTTIKMKPS